MPPAEFEPAIPANERQQTLASDRSALTNRPLCKYIVSLFTIQNVPAHTQV